MPDKISHEQICKSIYDYFMELDTDVHVSPGIVRVLTGCLNTTTVVGFMRAMYDMQEKGILSSDEEGEFYLRQ